MNISPVTRLLYLGVKLLTFIYATDAQSDGGLQVHNTGVNTSDVLVNSGQPAAFWAVADVLRRDFPLGSNAVLLAASPASPSSASAISLFPNGDFEAGPGVAWSQHSDQGWPLIVSSEQQQQVSPFSGEWAAWLGGDDLEVAWIEQVVDVPTGDPVLRFVEWIASEESSCGFDEATIVVGESDVIHTQCLAGVESTNGWNERAIALTAYAGQSVKIRFQIETDESLNSNLFLDDVRFEYSSDEIFLDGFEGGDALHWP